MATTAVCTVSVRGGRGAAQVNPNNKHVSVTLSLSAPDGRELLRDAQLSLTPRHRYALIGRNGSGKSSLLEAIASGGLGTWWPGSLTVGLVRQESAALGGATVLEVLLSARSAAGGRPSLEAERDRLEALLDDEDSEDPGAAAEKLAEVYDRLDSLEGPDAEREAAEVLHGLQFESTDVAAGSLSGGWQRRLALAQALFVRPDVLLLDEPTNHLDIAAMQWLAEHLVAEAATAIVVSHDPDFLEAVVTDVLSIERQGLYHTPGGWSSYSAGQAQGRRRDGALLDAALIKEAKLKASERKSTKSAKAKERSTAAKTGDAHNHESRAVRSAASRGEGKGATGLKQRKKGARERTLKTGGGEALSAAEVKERVAERRRHERSLAFAFSAAEDAAGLSGGHGSGEALVRLDDVAVGLLGGSVAAAEDEEASASSSAPERELLLRDVTLNVGDRARIAVLGRNGAGKSTLLRVVVGEEDGSAWAEVVAGQVARRQRPLRVAYVRQNHLGQLAKHLEETAAEFVAAKVGQMSGSAGCSLLEARQLLGSVGLGGSSIAKQRVGSLSGGERVRLILAAEVVAARPHLIVLDEPTNHLDGESLAALVVALRDFDGAVICVSHHREFVASFADEVWVVGDDRRVRVNRASDRIEIEAQLKMFAQQLRVPGGVREVVVEATLPPPPPPRQPHSLGSDSVNWRRSPS